MRNKLAVILNYVQAHHQLQPMTDHRPIATLPFAGRYRLIDFIFSSMYNAEIVSAALFISGSGHSLYDHIRSGSQWGLDSNVGGGLFTHSQVTSKLTNALDGEEPDQYYDNHRNYIDKSSANCVLLTGSGLLFNVNLNALLQSHRENRTRISAVFKRVARHDLPEDTQVTALAFSDHELVTDIVPVTSEMDEAIPANLKMVLVEKTLLYHFIDYAQQAHKLVDSDELIRYALWHDIDVSGFEYTGYLKSIETINDYYQANLDMLDETKFNSLFYRNSPVITRIHHSAPTYYGKQANVTGSLVASGGDIRGDVTASVLFRKVNVGEGTTIVRSIINSNSSIGEHVNLMHVILDKNVVIDDHVVLRGRIDQPIIIKKGTHVTLDISQELGA